MGSLIQQTNKLCSSLIQRTNELPFWRKVALLHQSSLSGTRMIVAPDVADANHLSLAQTRGEVDGEVVSAVGALHLSDVVERLV